MARCGDILALALAINWNEVHGQRRRVKAILRSVRQFLYQRPVSVLFTDESVQIIYYCSDGRVVFSVSSDGEVTVASQDTLHEIFHPNLN